MPRRRETPPPNPYPHGTRRQNALMLLWIRLSGTIPGLLPSLWALKDPVEIGMTEFTRIKTRSPEHRFQLTTLVHSLAEREKWVYRGKRRAFRFADGMSYGNILDCYFDKEEKKTA